LIRYSEISLCSDNAKIADLVSCTIVLEKVADAFATGSVLILTVAWMHAVDIFAIAWLDHRVIGVREVSERSIYGIEWDSRLHKLVVEVVSDGISGAWLWLVDLRVVCCTIFGLLSHCFLVLSVPVCIWITAFGIKAIAVHVIPIIIAWISEHIPSAFPIATETKSHRTKGCRSKSCPVVRFFGPVVCVLECVTSPARSVREGITNVMESLLSPITDVMVSIDSPVCNIVGSPNSPVSDVIEDVLGLSFSLKL